MSIDPYFNFLIFMLSFHEVRMLNPNTESKSNMMNHNHTFGSFEYMPMIHTIDFGRA